MTNATTTTEPQVFLFFSEEVAANNGYFTGTIPDGKGGTTDVTFTHYAQTEELPPEAQALGLKKVWSGPQSQLQNVKQIISETAPAVLFYSEIAAQAQGFYNTCTVPDGNGGTVEVKFTVGWTTKELPENMQFPDRKIVWEGLQKDMKDAKQVAVTPDMAFDSPERRMSAQQQISEQALMTSSFMKKLEAISPQQAFATFSADMSGMEQQKKEMRAILFRAQFDAARKARNLPVEKQNLNTIFTGGTGVGKGTLARHRAQLLHSLKLVGDKYVEVSRETMFGGFRQTQMGDVISPTENVLSALFQKADVIFLDINQAYNLENQPGERKNFNHRVIDALTTAFEVRNTQPVLFLAGFEEEIEKFIAAVPGLKNLMQNTVRIEELTAQDLGNMLEHNLAKKGYMLAADAKEYAVKLFDTLKGACDDTRKFENGLLVNTLIAHIPNKMSERLMTSEPPTTQEEVDAALMIVTKADIAAVGLAPETSTTMGFDLRIRKPFQALKIA